MSKAYVAGLDVHKKTIVIALIDARGALVEEATIAARRPDLVAWLEDLGRKSRGLRVALEASGSSAWVTYALLDAGVDVTAVHPNHVRAIAETKRKSDRLDARKLAELHRLGALKPVHIPTLEHRATRLLLRQMRRLVNQRTRQKNTLLSILTELGHVCPWTDAFGKSGRRWIAGLELDPLVRLVVDQQLAAIELATRQLDELDARLEKELPASPLYQLLRTIPGVGLRLGAAIALEFDDIRRFATAKAAACYTGLIPSTFQSGEKRRGGRITKQGNGTLRWALIQAVIQLVRRDPGAKKRYERLRNRIKRDRARVAMARRLVVAIWHMARSGEAFRRDESPPMKRPRKVKAKTAEK